MAGKEELCRNLEQQIAEYKQNFIKHESEVAQLKKALDNKEETIRRYNISNALYAFKLRAVSPNESVTPSFETKTPIFFKYLFFQYTTCFINFIFSKFYI